jgi:hypothetical protein
MALTVEELLKSRDDPVKERSQGVLEYADQNGERLRYKSDREMAAALAALDRLIAEAGGRTMPRTILVKTSKGLG